MKSAAVCVGLALSLAACSGGNGGGGGETQAKSRRECGFAPAEGKIDEDQAPDVFFIEGAELTYLDVTNKDLIVAGSVPYDIEGSLKRYRDRVEASDYEILGVDNEGFEAEIYLQNDEYLGAIRLGRSKCLDMSFVNMGFRANDPDRGRAKT